MKVKKDLIKKTAGLWKDLDIENSQKTGKIDFLRILTSSPRSLYPEQC